MVCRQGILRLATNEITYCLLIISSRVVSLLSRFLGHSRMNSTLMDIEIIYERKDTSQKIRCAKAVVVYE
jgi:hypothetical protein